MYLGADYSAEARIRSKFARWNLDILPGHIPARVLRSLHLVGGRCRPCVHAMLFRTMWNGWPTDRRMGQDDSACRLGCLRGLDRIEHYAVCPVAWSFFRLAPPAGLGLDPRLRRLDAFLCIAADMDSDQKVKMAIAVYATARTVQQCRARSKTSSRPK